MMYGIPVIVSDLSGVRIPVYYTNNGYTFKRGNYKELANCIIKIKNSKNLFDKKQIQNKCMKYFNEKEFTNRYLSLFN
jgi:glycosyltransferase involved in cell wall biosynthesis